MAADLKSALHDSVQNFKKWVKEAYPNMTEQNDNGEYVYGAEYDDMISCVINTIEDTSPEDADAVTVDDMLYAIARDNESNVIADTLEDHPKWFSLLCRKSADTGYINAKWQFADKIGEYKYSDDLTDVLYAFLESGDEYTERMALRSLGKTCPEQAEQYAVKFFERNIYEADQYQKMMALEVLYETGSAKLVYYLQKAESSDSPYLKNIAADIRRKL